MNRWAMMLTDAPPTLQRLIARRRMPAASARRRLTARLALPEDAASALCRWFWPLLVDLGLLAPHGADAALAPAGQRFPCVICVPFSHIR